MLSYHGCFAIDYDATSAQVIFDRKRTSGEDYLTLDVWLISFWRTKRSLWGGMLQNGSITWLKIQISRIQTKPAQSHISRRAHSDSIFFFENGVRMANISRSQVFPK